MQKVTLYFDTEIDTINKFLEANPNYTIDQIVPMKDNTVWVVYNVKPKKLVESK